MSHVSFALQSYFRVVYWNDDQDSFSYFCVRILYYINNYLSIYKKYYFNDFFHKTCGTMCQRDSHLISLKCML
jgi:hypothetical protein